MTTAPTKAFVILDGTRLPIDRIAADRPSCSGKHKNHGVNVQVPTDSAGRLLWASPALPGAVHDIKAACTHSMIDALEEAGVECWAAKSWRLLRKLPCSATRVTSLAQAVLTFYLTRAN